MGNEAIDRLEQSGAFPELTSKDLAQFGASARLVRIEAGDPLIVEGSQPDHAYVLISGSMEVTREVGGVPVELGVVDLAGSVIGEVAMLAGGTRNATVRARELSTVVEIDRADFGLILDHAPESARRVAKDATRRIEETKLAIFAARAFGTQDPGLISELSRTCEWLRVAGGEVVFKQDDEADAAYVILSGRVDVTATTIEGEEKRLAELGPGEVFGELGLIDSAPRAATVTTHRDCLLVRFPRPVFELLMDRRPRQMVEIARAIVRRTTNSSRPSPGGLVISVAGASGLDASRFTEDLVGQLALLETTTHLSPDRIDGILDRPGASEVGSGDPGEIRLIRLLQESELSSSVLVLETGRTQTNWSQRALRQSDRVVVVSSPEPDATERLAAAGLFSLAPPRARRVLLVVHEAAASHPSGSARLKGDTGADELIHVRHHDTADLARVARLISGHAYGLVLGGGGARGFAHIGVYQALTELGVPIDLVGGSSIGSVFAATIASELSPEQVTKLSEQFFRGVLDYTIPVVSLVKGERIMKSIDGVWRGIDIEDLWRGFFCISTNLTRSRPQVHRTGSVSHALRASVAIPGVIPPVPWGDDLLVDGGVLDNLPVGPMREMLPFGTIMAVDVAPAVGPRSKGDFGMSVSGWKALMSRAGLSRGRAFPGIVAILLRSTIAGSSSQLQEKIRHADLYLDLDLRGIPMLDFETVAPVVQAGYDADLPRIAAWLEGRARDRGSQSVMPVP